MTVQDDGLALPIRAPDPCGLIIGSGQNAQAVGTEHRAGDMAFVTTQDDGLTLPIGAPDSGRLVAGSRQNARTVGTEYSAVDPVIVTAQDGGLALTIGAPDPEPFPLSSEAVRTRVPSED